MIMTTKEALECAMAIFETRKKKQQDIYDFNIKAIKLDAESAASTRLNDIVAEVRRANDAEILIEEYGIMLSLLRDILDIYEKEMQK